VSNPSRGRGGAWKNPKMKRIGAILGSLPHERVESARTHGTGIVDLDKDLTLSRDRYGYLFDLGIGL
jgi:hypothetical protein